MKLTADEIVQRVKAGDHKFVLDTFAALVEQNAKLTGLVTHWHGKARKADDILMRLGRMLDALRPTMQRLAIKFPEELGDWKF